MSAVEKIKAAAAELDPDEQFELLRWWVESDSFKARQLAALKRDITIGIEQLENGRYQTCDNANVMQLAEDIGRAGRKRLEKNRHDGSRTPTKAYNLDDTTGFIRLNALRLKVTAKVHGKK